MRLLGWIEVQTRAFAARFKKEPAQAWLRWARASYHGDVALACLDRAVALGDADAVFELGLLEMEGLYGAVEPSRTLRRAAEQGHSEAMARLASCLRFGPGEERNPEEAKRWLIRAAEGGFRPAAMELAAWLEGAGEADQAEVWRARAAAMAPRTLRHGLLKPLESRDPVVRAQTTVVRHTERCFEAMLRQPWAPPLFAALVIAVAAALVFLFVMASVFSLGLLPAVCVVYFLFFGRGRRHAWAFRRLVDAAEGGDVDAAFRLGGAYLKGLPGSAPDALSAAVWFRRAAESGHRGAMAALAEALRTGHGVRRDPGEAEAWVLAARG